MTLTSLLPESLKPYAKAVYGALTLAILVVQDLLEFLPAAWQPPVVVGLGIAGVVAVYLAPNEKREEAPDGF